MAQAKYVILTREGTAQGNDWTTIATMVHRYLATSVGNDIKMLHHNDGWFRPTDSSLQQSGQEFCLHVEFGRAEIQGTKCRSHQRDAMTNESCVVTHVEVKQRRLRQNATRTSTSIPTCRALPVHDCQDVIHGENPYCGTTRSQLVKTTHQTHESVVEASLRPHSSIDQVPKLLSDLTQSPYSAEIGPWPVADRAKAAMTFAMTFATTHWQPQLPCSSSADKFELVEGCLA